MLSAEAEPVSDILDSADLITELFLRSALSRKQPEGPRANGHCHFCQENIEWPNRWCDKDCLEDWEKEQRAKQHVAIYDE